MPAAMIPSAITRARSALANEQGLRAVAEVTEMHVAQATNQQSREAIQEDGAIDEGQRDKPEHLQSKELAKLPAKIFPSAAFNAGTVIEVTDADEGSPPHPAPKRTVPSLAPTEPKRRRTGSILLSQQLKLSASQRLKSSRRSEAKKTKGGWILDRKRPSSSSEKKAPQLEVQPVRAESVAEDKRQVLFSGFITADLQRLKKSVIELGGAAVRELPFGPGAAHVRVIMRCQVPEDEEDILPLAASRTLKYFDGILAGAWVLSPEWVHSSLKAGRWLPEAAFELAGDSNSLGGPARGRHHGPSLFAGLRLHFAPSQDGIPGSRGGIDEDLGPQPHDLERLARRAGAEVVDSICRLPDAQEDPPHLASEAREAGKRPRRSSFFDGQKGAPENSTLPASWWRKPILVLPNDVSRRRQRGNQSRAGPASLAAGAGWVVAPANWIVDCISRCEILSPCSKP